MGRGNVCTLGKCEGLYFVDSDDYDVFHRETDGDEEYEVRLKRELDYSEMTSGGWLFDEEGTWNEYSDIIECFIDSFLMRFKSFRRAKKGFWLKGCAGDCSREVLMESDLFYICAEDNEWSTAIELIQKEDPYKSLSAFQKRHYMTYLNGIRDCLLDRLDSIGTYTGAWTSGTLKREELQKCVENGI